MKFFLLFAVLILAALPAFAQDADLPENMTYDPTHTGRVNEGAEQIRNAQRKSLTDKGFIRPDTVQVAIVHPDYMGEDQFGLQMSVPGVVSGCYELTPLEYEAKFVDPYFLDINVKKYRRVAPEGAKTNCGRQNKMSSALMVLDRKDLQTRGTKQIRFSTEAGSDTYDIELDDGQIELIPKSQMIFKGQAMGGPLKDRLSHSFTPGNVIVLQVPMAQPGEDISFQLIRFASSRALSPTDNAQKIDSSGRLTYSFLDQSGGTSSLIGEGGYAEIGQITVNRPYDGEQGRVETAVPLSVFATRPGTEL